MLRKSKFVLLLAAASALFFSGCSKDQTGAGADDPEDVVHKAIAIVHPTKGHNVGGKIEFITENGGVRIVADIQGLKPGKHGFHAHEHGDCSAPDASSAGGHYNPTNKKHGGPDSPERHVGDFGNLEADENGIAHYDRLDKVIELNGKYSIIGKSIIIHADADDFVSQPTGNSGARVACGLIEAVQ